MKSYDDPSDLPPTKEQRQRQAEEFRRTMRWWRDYFREHPVKTMEQLAKEEPEICTLCGEIGEAHWFDGERIHCPERTVN